MKTKSSRSTYVGSTPDPPRRLRQHNGELTQGAYKTRRGRPWAMTMIVHGFPSKLAALQFEWAWQHPYMSRHLRVSQTKQGKEACAQIFKRDSKSNLLKTKLLVARTMLPTSPYSTWPLHIKIFTEEAKQLWDEAQRIDTIEPLPKGLTVSVEFEGVDGKSATPVSQHSSGRGGPIEVKDAEFTLSHIRKYQSLINKETQMSCSVCSSEIDIKRMDHLRVALCPQTGCKTISHLDCLAQSFLEHPSNPRSLIPRGGVCKSCNEYTLWGDIIRGCYRRARGGLQQPTSEQESGNEGDDRSTQIGDDLSCRLENLQIDGSPRKAKKTSAARVTASKKKRPQTTKRGAQTRQDDSGVEDFRAEMDAIDCDTGDSEADRPSQEAPSMTKRRLHILEPTEGGGARADRGQPRDMDEIVRQALDNLSISSPGELNHGLARTKRRPGVEVIEKEMRDRITNQEDKRAMTNATLKPNSKRTPSPEYIDLEGI